MSIWRYYLRRVLVALAIGLVAGLGCAPNPSADNADPGAAPPRRIVSLTLGTDEILAELVPAERLAGVTALVDDPGISNVAGRYPKEIPRLRDADVERLLALHPDLVCVAPYNTADALKLLERSGLPVYRNEAVHSLDEIEAGIQKLAGRVGETERGRQLAGQMQARRQALARRLRDLARRPRVLFWSSGFTAGRRSTMDDILREAGAVNVAAELNLDDSVELSPERVIAADPDVVLVARWSGEDRQTHIDQHPILRNLRAVRAGQVIVIDGRYLTSVSHFAVEGAERLARQLHPKHFAGEAPS
jgi:iron complex transport system substrate-binding protein